MRFKNKVGKGDGNIILPNETDLILSKSELNKYKGSGLYKSNVVKMPDMDFKASSGKFVIILNDEEYNINVKEVQSDFYAVEVTVNDRVAFTVEKLREINKYDVIRGLIQNLRKIKEEKEYV